MKLLIPLMIFAALSNNAHANPGGNTLVCKSAKNSGSSQKLEVFVTRANEKGWINPTIKLSVDDNKFELRTPDENNNYGTTFHNSPLKVITVTVEVPLRKRGTTGKFSIIAIPSSVKAFDDENKPAKDWTLNAQLEGCFDTNGRAEFQGYINGYLRLNDNSTSIYTQLLDCELTYSSGMAC